MPEDRVTAYLEELLDPEPAVTDGRDESGPAVAPASPAYRLVRLCGLRLLLPPEFAPDLQTGDSPPEGLLPLDLRPVIFPSGHSALREDARPACWLPLAARGIGLWFDTDDGDVDVDDTAIAWKRDPSTRPWLLGTAADLKAAVIDPGLLADCAGRPIAGESDG